MVCDFDTAAAFAKTANKRTAVTVGAVHARRAAVAGADIVCTVTALLDPSPDLSTPAKPDSATKRRWWDDDPWASRARDLIENAGYGDTVVVTLTRRS